MPLRVRYIGTKEFHLDTLFRSKVAWHGHNDIQLVDAVKAQKMVKFCPGTYELAIESNKLPAKTVDKKKSGLSDFGDPLATVMVVEPMIHDTVPARQASRNALMRYADNQGIYLRDDLTRTEILKYIETALSDKDKVGVAEELREQESQDTALEKQFEGELVELMAKIDSVKKPTVAECRKFTFKTSGRKVLNAKVRDRAWKQSRRLRDEQEFERIQSAIKSKAESPTS